MDDKEVAYAKQGAMATTSWDCFQRLIRRCLGKGGEDSATATGGKEDKRHCQARIGLSVTIVVTVWLAWALMGGVAPAQAMTRTLERGPAIVIVAFGTTTDASATYDFFAAQLRNELPAEWQQAPVTWAYTSEIVRERVNKRFAEQGDPRRYRSLLQVLADLDDQGYRKIAVQSLHIFPGQEYEEMEKQIAAFRGLGLRIEYGGTLLHRWDMLIEAVGAVAPDFLPPNQGCTLLVTHGTPQTFPGSNSTYLGLDRYLQQTQGGVVALGTVDGIISRQEALGRAKKCVPARVRMVPFMYVAGDHIMNDIMGDKPDKEGTPSWAMELKKAGLTVESVTTEYNGHQVYKGLGLYPEINRIFIQQLTRSLKRLAP